MKDKLVEQGHDAQDSTHKIYSDMCATITHVIEETLPTVKKRRRAKRKVSERTAALYEQRTNMKGCTQGEFDELQAQIKQAGLDDFKDWVQEQGDIMAEANGRGDTKKIYEVVNALKGKSDKPPTNLTTDGQGGMLCGASYLWRYGRCRRRFCGCLR